MFQPYICACVYVYMLTYTYRIGVLIVFRFGSKDIFDFFMWVLNMRILRSCNNVNCIHVCKCVVSHSRVITSEHLGVLPVTCT